MPARSKHCFDRQAYKSESRMLLHRCGMQDCFEQCFHYTLNDIVTSDFMPLQVVNNKRNTSIYANSIQ